MQEERDRTKFLDDRVKMLEKQLQDSGIDFTPDYYKRLDIDVAIAEEVLHQAYQDNKDHDNALNLLKEIRKQEEDWEKKPVKRPEPKVFTYEGKNGEEKQLSINEREKDAWLKRAMNQPLTDREERLLLKLNNNILILETDQKLKAF